jgi:hypothetical protein
VQVKGLPMFFVVSSGIETSECSNWTLSHYQGAPLTPVLEINASLAMIRYEFGRMIGARARHADAQFGETWGRCRGETARLRHGPVVSSHV